MDIIVDQIVELLKSNCHSKKSVEYYISSETKWLCNITNADPISDVLAPHQFSTSSFNANFPLLKKLIDNTRNGTQTLQVV